MKKRNRAAPIASIATQHASLDPTARSVAAARRVGARGKRVRIATKHVVLEADTGSGRLTSMKVHGEEFLVPAETYFCRFQTLNVVGAPRCLSDAQASSIVITQSRRNELTARLRFDRQYFPTGHFEVEVRIRAAKNGSLEWTAVFHNTTGEALEWIECPGLVFKGDFLEEKGAASLFWPAQEGALVEGRTARGGSWLQNRPMGYPTPGWGGHYPGPTQMQFMAYMRKDKGLYIASHDPACNTKHIDYTLSEKGARIEFIHFCSASTAKRFTLGYPMVMTPYRGDWHDAADLYRQWAEAHMPALPAKTSRNKRMPKWVLDAPLVVTYPIRGPGHHAGATEPNEYAPPTKALPALRRLAEQLDTKLLVLLMHWEGTAPWSPPYVWPPLGGEADMRRFAKELHKDGHLLGLYCSGTGWTQISSTGNNRYDRTAEYGKKGLARFMCTGPRGEMYSLICNDDSIRWGYDICSETQFAVKVMVDEALKIGRAGVDYIQLFDQNLGCASYICYSPDHGHPPGPGPWQAASMNKLLRAVNAAFRKEKIPTVLGCEAAAAEPFIAELPVNDLRAMNGWEVGVPVPAYSYVYHEYTGNFYGNQCGILDGMDAEKMPLNWHMRAAHAFTSGDMLTAIIKDGGQITWGWCVKWDVPPPPQDTVIPFQRLLLEWRRERLAPYLVYGRMLKPFAVRCAIETGYRRRGSTFRTPAIMTTRWRSPRGREAQVFANWTDRKQTGRVVLDKARNYTLSGSGIETVKGKGSAVAFTLPPFSVAALEC